MPAEQPLYRKFILVLYPFCFSLDARTCTSSIEPKAAPTNSITPESYIKIIKLTTEANDPYTKPELFRPEVMNQTNMPLAIFHKKSVREAPPKVARWF